MSYSQGEIDFSGIHVSCLIGANGAGKSSLLDAVTWTVWEEGRARTDELIKLGRDEMSCELEFFMEDELYRVYRSRTRAYKNSQGKSNLEFQIFNPTVKSWTSLSMSSTRQTQDLIIKTLKMDYETFINSVYLRQGKADEFTVKKPNERKQILADILGLEAYDKLCESAREKVRSIEQSISVEEGIITSLREKVLSEAEIKQNLEKVSLSLKKEEVELLEIRKNLLEKEKELNEKKEKEKQIQTLEKSKDNQESLIQTLEGQLTNIRQREEKCKKLIDKKEQIGKDYLYFQSMKKNFEVLEKNKEIHDVLAHERNTLELKLKDKISTVEQNLAVYKSKISERNNLKIRLSEKVKNEKIFNDFSPRAEKQVIEEFKNLRDLLVEIESEGQALKHEKDLLELESKGINEKKNEINEKIKTLNSHSHTEPCPLCKSPIKDKEKIVESYESEIDDCRKKEKEINSTIERKEAELSEKRNQYNQIKEKVNNFGAEIVKHLKELESIKQEKIDFNKEKFSDSVKAVSFFQSQLDVSRSEFEKAKEQISLLDNEISGCESELTSLMKLLSSGEIVKDISERLSKIKMELETIKYDSKQYDEIKQNIKEKEGINTLHASLKEAESEITTLRSEMISLESKIAAGRVDLNELITLILKNKDEINNLKTLIQEVESVRQKEKEINSSFEKVKKEMLILEQTLSGIEDAKQKIKDKEALIEKSLSDKKYYELLEKAFSKNGIQAAIIETVVPEIENEANRLLARLTENQMHIGLKTQREKKSSSGIIETLDVVIADSAGTRNYELYSGGEAFKIDFAVRLALSRLLTNRAGAKLRTLIIDEGFGSQDTSGRERLVEVIKSVQNEFELILVVTHIDELKESFPTHLLVTKDDEGSKVTVMS